MTVTDKELLELAAKAAGIELKPMQINNVTKQGDDRFIGYMTNPQEWSRGWFDPLKDDGDALRLAVKLDIEFYQADDEGRASYAGYWGKPERRDVTRMFCIEYHDDLLHKGDSYAATRRAIVRAAAAIGEGM